MNRLQPGLFVSSIMAQHEQANVYARGIRAVLRLDHFRGQRWTNDFHVLHLPLDGREAFSDEEISTCTEFISMYTDMGQPVLIQSQRGIGRAVSMAMAYMIEYQEMTLAQAFVRVLLRHPDAHPYTEQLLSLIEHYELPYSPDIVRAPGFFQRLVGEAQMSVNHIHNGVFIGSILALQQMSRIRSLGIESVLRLDRIDRSVGQWGDEFTLMDLPLPDGTPLLPDLLASGTAFIREQVSANRKVLVHCQMGVSRASTFVIAHLIENEGMSLPRAFQLVQQQRPIIQPNPQLVQSLVKYYELPYANNAAIQPTFLEDLLVTESHAV